jgi:hypothetical protein
MIWHDVEQNTDEWLDLRTGKLTASSMSKVMANYGKAFGEPAKKLAVSIAVEQVTGKRINGSSFSNEHTERGHVQEPIARALYEEENFVTVSNGGFFESDELGCSPDGLVYDDGLIEIKSVLDHVHYANIKRNDIDPSYKWQVYFNLWLTERNWIDFVSYCADYPEDKRLFVVRKYDFDCIEQFAMMQQRIGDFFKLVDEAKSTILE